MKKRSLIVLVIACIFGVTMLASCGGSKNSKNDVVTLKWIQVGGSMPKNYDAWLKQINPYLEEKIGVNVDMEIVSWGDWDNRKGVITNSGEYFDILFTNGSSYAAEAANGVYMDITDMIRTAAPALYSFIPADYWEAVKVDNRIYGVPTYKDSSITHYFIWDVDKANKYGIDYKNIDNYDDLYVALSKIKKGEGKAPYRMSSNGADFMTSSFDDIGAGLPLLGIKYNDTSKTFVNPLDDKEVRHNLDVIRRMYKEGIINGDAVTADDSDSERAFFTAQGWSGAAKSVWGPNNGIKNCEAIQYTETIISNSSVRGSVSGIFSGCKNPEKALQLLEIVNTDSKVRDLLFYGVEGDNFEYTANHKVNKLNSEWPMAGYTQGTFFNVTPLASVEVNEWDEVKALNASATPSVVLGYDLDTSSVEAELANCWAVYNKYKAEIWTGARDPAELIPIVKEELSIAGWDKIREVVQAQVR